MFPEQEISEVLNSYKILKPQEVPDLSNIDAIAEVALRVRNFYNQVTPQDVNSLKKFLSIDADVNDDLMASIVTQELISKYLLPNHEPLVRVITHSLVYMNDLGLPDYNTSIIPSGWKHFRSNPADNPSSRLDNTALWVAFHAALKAIDESKAGDPDQIEYLDDFSERIVIENIITSLNNMDWVQRIVTESFEKANKQDKGENEKAPRHTVSSRTTDQVIWEGFDQLSSWNKPLIVNSENGELVTRYITQMTANMAIYLVSGGELDLDEEKNKAIMEQVIAVLKANINFLNNKINAFESPYEDDEIFVRVNQNVKSAAVIIDALSDAIKASDVFDRVEIFKSSLSAIRDLRADHLNYVKEGLDIRINTRLSGKNILGYSLNIAELSAIEFFELNIENLLDKGNALSTLKLAWRETAKSVHPDLGKGSSEAFKEAKRRFNLLKRLINFLEGSDLQIEDDKDDTINLLNSGK